VKGNVNGSETKWLYRSWRRMTICLSCPLGKGTVRDLEESEEVTGEKIKAEGKEKGVKEKIVVEICKRFGILSQSTSYVAWKREKKKTERLGNSCLGEYYACDHWLHGMGRSWRHPLLTWSVISSQPPRQ